MHLDCIRDHSTWPVPVPTEYLRHHKQACLKLIASQSILHLSADCLTQILSSALSADVYIVLYVCNISMWTKAHVPETRDFRINSLDSSLE